MTATHSGSPVVGRATGRAPAGRHVSRSRPGLPVQYMTPFFAQLANSGEMDLTVLYFTRMGLETLRSVSPISTAKWSGSIDLLDGYRSKFLWNPITANGHRRATVMAPEILRELSRSRYDVLVNFGWQFPANLLAALAARRARIPMLMYTDADVRHANAGNHPALSRLCGAADGQERRRRPIHRNVQPRPLHSIRGIAGAALVLAVGRRQLAVRDTVARRRARDSGSATTPCISCSSAPSSRARTSRRCCGSFRMQVDGKRVGALLAASGPESDRLQELSRTSR